MIVSSLEELEEELEEEELEEVIELVIEELEELEVEVEVETGVEVTVEVLLEVESVGLLQPIKTLDKNKNKLTLTKFFFILNISFHF